MSAPIDHTREIPYGDLPRPAISVIIPAYDDASGVMTAINSLQAMASHDQPIQYIVADDASPHVDLRGVVPADRAQVIRGYHNCGFAGNCHRGANISMGHILLFMNQDAYAVPQWSQDWDQHLLAAFQREDVGIVGARLLFPDGRIQSAGGLFDARVQPFHRHLGYSNPHHPDVATAGEVPWVTGAALAIRADVWFKLGGFDLSYERGYFEDVDLCLKVQDAGYVVWYEPRWTLVHSVGSTGGSPYFQQNARLFHARWANRLTPDDIAVRVNFW